MGSALPSAGVKATMAAQSLPCSHRPDLLHHLWAAWAGFGRFQPWLLVPSEQQLWPCSVVGDHTVHIPHPTPLLGGSSSSISAGHGGCCAGGAAGSCEHYGGCGEL